MLRHSFLKRYCLWWVVFCIGWLVCCVGKPTVVVVSAIPSSTSTAPLEPNTPQPENTPTPRLWQRDETLIYSIPDMAEGTLPNTYLVALSVNDVGNMTDKQIAAVLLEKWREEILKNVSVSEQFKVLDYRVDAVQYETEGRISVTASIKPFDITKYVLSTGERQGDWWVGSQAIYDVVKIGNLCELFGPYSG